MVTRYVKSTYIGDSYRYKNNKGEISLIKIPNFLYENRPYEIYCIKGKLFSFAQNFSSFKKAEERIALYLGEDLYKKQNSNIKFVRC